MVLFYSTKSIRYRKKNIFIACILIMLLLELRFFDITKLGPVKYFEKMPGAWGVMTDDLVAGFISLAIILILHSFIL